jgi:hypothetical protein
MFLAALATAQVAFAAGPSGGGAAANARAGGAVGAGAALPGAGANTGGTANIGAGAAAGKPDVPSPNTKALENANGQFTEERQFGQDRAAERRSEQGTENEKATDALEDKASANARPARRPSAESTTNPTK